MIARASAIAILLFSTLFSSGALAGEAGDVCKSPSECGPGLFCHSRWRNQCPGTSSHAGVCARRPPFCPQNCEPLCGCDGQTYCNECLAHRAGTAVAHAGACTSGASSCAGNGDCASGQYCESPPGACGKPGVCRARPEICTDLFQPVCGCDHKTYPNACGAERAGVSVAENSSCTTTGSQCTTATDCRNPLPHLCKVCPDGKSVCAHYVCKAGQCAVETCPE